MITIQGELVDLNSYIGALNSHRYVGSKTKKEQTELCAMYAMKCKEEIKQFPVHITYKWYTKNKRKDIDNVSFSKKFINDGLVLAGILPDDSRKYVQGFTDEFYIDKENPRVEIIFNQDDM